VLGRRKRPNSVVDVAAMYRELRQLALTVDPADYELPEVGAPRLYGAVMELGWEEATATVVGLTDGTTSLYATSGFGIIGGGARESVRQASAAWLVLMSQMVHELQPAADVQPPATSDVQFIALTYDGHRVGQASELSLQRDRSPLAPLYVAGQRVITELRLVDEQVRAARRGRRGR
jgi:hypothetical protein